MAWWDNFADKLRGNKKEQPVMGEISLADMSQVIGKGSFEVYNPSGLVSRKGLSIYDKMRKDDQVKAALQFKKHTVIATGWAIDSPLGKPDNWEVTEFVRKALDDIPKTFTNKILEIMSSLDYGFSISEKIWDIKDNYIVYKNIKTRRPHDWAFISDQYGDLRAVKQQQGASSPELNPNKFVIMTYAEQFQNHYGESDLEAAYRPWWAKENAYLWMSMYLERFGIPPVFLMYDPTGLKPQQITDMKNLIQNIQAASMGMFPRRNKDSAEFWSPDFSDQAGQAFIPSIEMYNKDIARAILMPGLLGMTPDDNNGSQARSRVMFDVFMLVVDRLRDVIQDHIVNEQIIKPLVDFNFNLESDEYPMFKLLPITDDARLDILDKWSSLTGASVVTPQYEDEEHIRDMLEFPPLSAGVRPTNEEARKERDEMKQSLKEGSNDKDEEDNPGKKFAQHVLEDELDEHEEVYLGKLTALLEEAQSDIINKVSKGKPVDKIKGAIKIKTVLGDMLTAAFAMGVNTLTGKASFAVRTPRDAQSWLRQKKIAIAGILDQTLLNKVSMILVNSIKTGETSLETQSKIRKAFLPFIGDEKVIKDDSVINPYRLENIVRTNTTEAFNQGRIVAALDPDLAGSIKGMQYLAILDTRTTEVCTRLHGKVFRLDDPDLNTLAPPNHYMCRSILSPVFIDEELNESDIITVAEAGAAKELAGEFA